MSDDLVLAAVGRAERHREREGAGMMMSDIAEHLGFVRGSWTTRRLRPQIEAARQRRQRDHAHLPRRCTLVCVAKSSVEPNRVNANRSARLLDGRMSLDMAK